jgi:hypothetical protein
MGDSGVVHSPCEALGEYGQCSPLSFRGHHHASWVSQGARNG